MSDQQGCDLGWGESEGVADEDAAEHSAVLQVFAEEQLATGTACGSPEQRVPELEAMLLVCGESFKYVFTGGGHGAEQLSQVYHQLLSLWRQVTALLSGYVAQFAERLRWNDATILIC